MTTRRRRKHQVENYDLNQFASSSSTSANAVTHSRYKVLLFLLILRIANVYLVQTWFSPDEYWQSLEVAHRIVFGYGHLTWEWKEGIRSHLHPLIFAAVYYVLKLTGLEGESGWMIYAPRMTQAIISALAEWTFFNFVTRYFGRSIANWTIASLCMSWFWFYCCTRTFVNSTEASLLCVVISVFPWKQTKHSNLFMFTFIASLATAMRPTISVMLLPLYLLYFYRCKSFKAVLSCFLQTVFIALLVILLSILIDHHCYGKWINVHYNFLSFNLFQNRGTFYGSHPWHWYFTQGLPVVMTTHLPLAMHGWFICMDEKQYFVKERRSIISCFLFIVVTTLLVFSFPGHKEFRFLLPLLPLCIFFCGLSLDGLTIWKRNVAIAFLLITNIPVIFYFGFIHQAAPLNIMEHLSKSSSFSILFLTPCHSTPYLSFIHKNISMRFLTCEPDFLNRRDSYLDEADLFYKNPPLWVQENLLLSNQLDASLCSVDLPNHIVMYDVLLEKLFTLLKPCYNTCYRAFHTQLPQGRIGRYMVILCKL